MDVERPQTVKKKKAQRTKFSESYLIILKLTAEIYTACGSSVRRDLQTHRELRTERLELKPCNYRQLFQETSVSKGVRISYPNI